nr:hypothetical protein [uncultured Dyadobacter sp.]
MRFLFALFFVLSAANRVFAQVLVGDVDINKEENVGIVEVLITERFSSKSVNVFVDYGQKTNFRADSFDGDDKDRKIFDPELKKEKVFASTAALLSFMERNGWEHYDSLMFRDDNRVAAYYYYFRRKR